MAKAKTKQQLTIECEELRVRLQEMEDTLEAIRSGAVDAIVASGPAGDQVYTLEGADHAYHMMVESMNEGAVTLTLDGTILYGNRQFAQMTGSSPSNVVGRRFHNFVSVSDQPILNSILDRGGLDSPNIEIGLRNGPGADIPVQISTSPLELGDSKALTLVISDLSTQKRFEEIVAAEKLSRRILEQAQEAIAVCIDGCIVRANRALYDICGCIPLMQPFDQIFSLRISESETFSVATPESGNTIQKQEVRYQRPDGKIFDLILSAGPITGQENKIIGTLITLVDISDRKRDAEVLQSTLQRFYTVLSSMHSSILLVSDDGRVEYANQAFCDYVEFQCSPADLKKLSAHEVIEKIRNVFLDPDEAVARIMETLAKGQPVLGEEVAARGGRTYLRDFIPLHVDGKSYGRLWHHWDITELKKAEETLRRAHERTSWLARFPEENPAPVLRVSPTGAILYCNPAATELDGWKCQVGQILPGPILLLVSQAMAEGSEVRNDVELGQRAYAVSIVPFLGENYANVYGRDVTERIQAEYEREMTVQFLRLVNENAASSDLIRKSVEFFQDSSGCEAVGIRLKQGDDYPYYEVRGFPPEFVQAENQLCTRDEADRLRRDSDGQPVLECMCGNVISGRFAPDKPFFTGNGSFWTNCTTQLLASTTEADRQARTRNRCNGDGYESVALIALRVGEQRLGLLQLNDKRKGRFTQEKIALWERLAGYLAVALAKLLAQEELQRLKDELEQKIHERTAELMMSLEDLEKGRDNLRKLASELVMTEERERKRIAVTLHDEVAQSLAAAKMRLDLLRKVTDGEASSEVVDEARDLIAQSIRETRSLMNEISSPILYNMGLPAAVQNLVEQASARYGLAASHSVSGEFGDLGQELGVLIYQALRELLHNISKHGQAINASVQVIAEESGIRVIVTDDGRGFDANQIGSPSRDSGFGLFSIRERVKSFNGSMLIESAPGRGTKVTIALPMMRRKENETATETDMLQKLQK